MNYNATATLARTYARMSEDDTDTIIDALIDYHPAISADPTGKANVIITLPADSLHQAISTANALFVALRPVGLEVVPTDLWDRRAGITRMPDLLSVTDVATRLGVTRQAVLQRIDSGSLPAIKVGKSWAVPAAAVTAA